MTIYDGNTLCYSYIINYFLSTYTYVTYRQLMIFLAQLQLLLVKLSWFGFVEFVTLKLMTGESSVS